MDGRALLLLQQPDPFITTHPPTHPQRKQHEAAKKAMEELNGQKFPDGEFGEKELYVRRLQTKKERQRARDWLLLVICGWKMDGGCGWGGG